MIRHSQKPGVTGLLSRAKQAGLSIVEVMIALTISTILTIGVVQLFVANSETYNMLMGQSRIQENARFALEYISRSVRMAGYKGCFSVNGRVSTTIDPDTDIPYEYDIRQSILGYEGVSDGNWLPSLNELPGNYGGADTSYVPGAGITSGEVRTGAGAWERSDVLVIRRISNNDMLLAEDMLTSSDDIVAIEPAGGLDLGCAGCVNDKPKDDLALIYDCEKSTIFRVTDIAAGTGAGEVIIKHNVADLNPQNAVAQLAEFNTFEGLDAGVAAIVTDIFYIAEGSGVNNVGDRPWSLWRKSGISPPMEIVEGIENFQVEFGVDTDSDGIPNQYVTPNLVAPADRRFILTVRVEIVATSVDDVGSEKLAPGGNPADGIMRRQFSQTMQVRNKG